MRVPRVTGLAVAALVAGLLTPLGAANADPPPPLPYALVDSPAAGPLNGTITVTGEGHLDPAADPLDMITQLELLVDGAVSGAPFDCAPLVTMTPDDCVNATFSLDGGSLTAGPHTIQIRIVDSALTAPPVDSPPVTLVVPGPPTVAITAVSSLGQPVADGGQVTGNVSVSATGTVDAASTDAPAKLELFVGAAATPADSFTCTAPSSCSHTLVWDSTGINASRILKVVFTTATDATPSDSVTVRAVNPIPTAQVVSTSAVGGHFKGTLSVVGTGATDPNQSDTTSTLQLYVDGTDAGSAIGSAIPCPSSVNPDACNVPFSWDATGDPGTHTIRVRLHTTKNVNVFSPSVTVTADNAPPSVSITSPPDGATLSGPIAVNATGTVDSSQSDYAKTMQLYVNDDLKDSADCATGDQSCQVVLNWDSSGVTGTEVLKVKLTTHTGLTAVTTRTVNVTTTPPVAAVTSPANGSTVSGVVSVVTSGAINPTQSDSPASMQLLIDGTATAAANACSSTVSLPHGCSTPYVWDTTGMSGTHTLQAKFLTHRGFTVYSPVTTVTVVSPGPSATITSPSSSSTVHRTATIAVTAAVDPSQTDTPSAVQVTLDGKPLGAAVACAATSRTCLATVAWNTVGLTGRHTLTATVATRTGRTAVSRTSYVYVYGGTAILLVAAKAHPAGRAITYTGRVTALINKSSVAGVKVKVLIRPAVGKAKTLYVLTNVHGYFKVAFKPAVNTTVEATMLALPYYGTSHTFTKLHVIPKASCSVGSSVRRNVSDAGVCTVANLPKTTKVTLEYAYAGKWYVLGSGKAKGPKISFSVRFAKRGAYLVRVILSATSVFTGLTGPSVRLQVT